MKNELVTVSVSTYNRFNELINTLETIVNQTYKILEIIVVDDCSNDLTSIENLKKKFPNETRIKYYRHEKNMGLASARNTALKNSKGKFFTFIDDDDLWDKYCVENFIKHVNKYDNSHCFCAGIKYKNNFFSYISKSMSLKDAIYAGWTPPVSAQFYYKDSLTNIGGFNENIKSGVDHDIWLNLSIKNINIVFISECVSIPNFKLNHNSMTSNYNKRINGINKSLKIWKPIIVNNYSYDFYIHFFNQYNLYLFKFFLIKNIKTLNIKELIKIIYLNKNYRILFYTFLLLIKKFANLKKNNYIKPTFKNFYD